MAGKSLKCKVCGGPLPEQALIVIGSLRYPGMNKPVRCFAASVMDATHFDYITRASQAVCGHWCAVRLISRKLEEVMDGPQAAAREKVSA